MKKVIKIIINIIMVLAIIIILLVGYNLFQIKYLKQDYGKLFGYTIFKVITGSMSNTIEIGDIIIVKLGNNDIEVNDIIVIKQENYIVTHRIIERNENNIITKGDANNKADEPITTEQVIGKVVKIIPNIAIWERVFATPEVFISLTITFILCVLVFSYKDNKNMENDKK
ncbi:MAG: signal peptidase I [Clostridia bacterium]|nr:signal peptidase I [Clostridia bacterium]